MKTRTFSALFFALALAGLAGSLMAQDEKQKTDPKAENNFYVINYRVTNMEVRMELNGVPVYNQAMDQAQSGFMQVHEWLHNGMNTLVVEAKATVATGKEAELGFSLSIVKQGEFSDKGRKMIQYSLPRKPDGTPDATVKFPLRLTYAFRITDFPRTYMDETVKLQLTPPARIAVLALVASLHKALAEGNVEEIARLTFFKFCEAERATYLPVPTIEQYRVKIVEMMGIFKKENLQPLDTAKLRMRLVADGKVIWITGTGDESPLRFKDTENEFSLPLYIGFTAGRWELVR